MVVADIVINNTRNFNITVAETDNLLTKPSSFFPPSTQAPYWPGEKGRSDVSHRGSQNLPALNHPLFLFRVCWLVGVPQFDLGNHVLTMAESSPGPWRSSRASLLPEGQLDLT